MITLVQTATDGEIAAPVADPCADGHHRDEGPGSDVRLRQSYAPPGHWHIRFNRLARSGDEHSAREDCFQISQLAPRPGRIHHCMRAIGQREGGST